MVELTFVVVLAASFADKNEESGLLISRLSCELFVLASEFGDEYIGSFATTVDSVVVCFSCKEFSNFFDVLSTSDISFNKSRLIKN